MITGVHPGTMNNLQLGAGLFLKDFDFGAAADAPSLLRLIRAAVADERHILGATRGGSQFSYQPVLRSLDANGVRQPFVGGVLCDGSRVSMKGTLLEVTPENLALLMTNARIEQRGQVAMVTACGGPYAQEHLDNLCWIGEYGSGYLLIELTGALNTCGVTLAIADRGEGSIPFVFEGHAAAPDEDEAPFRMLWFRGGDAV